MTITGTNVLQREPGATAIVAPYGPRGPVIAGTSLTPVNVANGPVVFTMTEYGLGFAPGIRVRATALDGTGAPTTNWLEGVVTDYEAAQLEVTADIHGGGGIYQSWQITVAGQPGLQGVPGPKGDTGEIPEAPQNHLKYVRIDGQWFAINTDLDAKAPIDNPVLTGNPQLAQSPATSDNDKSIATTEYVKANIAALTFQPLDADLTSLAAAAATGSTGIHYRKSANTWVPLTMGSGITLDTTANTLNVTAGGGNVSASGAITVNDVAQWASSNTIKSVPIATLRANAVFSDTFTFAGSLFDINIAASAGNGFRFAPQASGSSPRFEATGVDTNISIVYAGKGTGGHYFQANNTYAFGISQPGAGADIFLVTRPSVGKCELYPSVAGKPIAIAGRTDGSEPAAGTIGEYLQAGPFGSGPLGLTQWYATGSLYLPAGDWDIWGLANVNNMGGLAVGSCYIALGEGAGSPIGESQVTGVAGVYGDCIAQTGIIRRNSNAGFYIHIMVWCSVNAFYTTGGYIKARRRS